VHVSEEIVLVLFVASRMAVVIRRRVRHRNLRLRSSRISDVGLNCPQQFRSLLNTLEKKKLERFGMKLSSNVSEDG